MDEHADLADLASLTVEDIKVFRILSACGEPKLSEKLFNIMEPTLEKVKREAMAYEIGVHDAKHLAKAAKANLAAMQGNGREERNEKSRG